MNFCPVCGSENSIEVFKESERPKYALQIHTSRQSALQCEKVTVCFVYCLDCQFAYNKNFHPMVMDYKEEIETSRSCSEYFNNYIISVCKQVNEVFSVKDNIIVEIGCGDGQFLIELRKLFSYKGWGFDPSLVKSDKLPSYKDLTFVPDYYKDDCLDKKPDLIVLRHILEHISNAKQFLNTVISDKKGYSPSIYVEVPAWEWIVDNDQIMMFSNDHCSYYSKNSLELALTLCGFKCEKTCLTFADEYLQYFGKKNSLVDTSKISKSDQVESSEHFGTDLNSRTKSFIKRMPKVLDRFESYFLESPMMLYCGVPAGKELFCYLP